MVQLREDLSLHIQQSNASELVTVLGNLKWERFFQTPLKLSWSVEQLEGYTDRSRFRWCSCSFYYLFDLHFEGVVSNSGGLGTAWLLKGSCIWATSQLVFSVTLQLHGLGMAWKNLPLALCTSWSFSYLEVLKPFTDLSQVPKPFFPLGFPPWLPQKATFFGQL